MKTAKLSQGPNKKVQKRLFCFAVQSQMRSEKIVVKATEKGSLRTHVGSILEKYSLQN